MNIGIVMSLKCQTFLRNTRQKNLISVNIEQFLDPPILFFGTCLRIYQLLTMRVAAGTSKVVGQKQLTRLCDEMLLFYMDLKGGKIVDSQHHLITILLSAAKSLIFSFKSDEK